MGDEESAGQLHTRRPFLVPVGAIGWMSFLFCVNCGGAMIALNYLLLNMRRQAAMALMVTLLATVVFWWCILQMPESSNELLKITVVNMMLCLATYAVTNRLQGKLIELHVAQGGEFMSVWIRMLIGIGIACLNILGCSIFQAILNHFHLTQ